MADVELSTLGSVIKTAYEAETNTNAYTDAEKSKLAGVEASADVTDTANVTAAGALMDSEVTNLAAVKAFDPTDYATAAQGTTADAALPADGSGEMTGDLVFAEAADHSSTPGAGKGYVWVKNTAPSTLIFTNDAGTDTTLGSGGGASQLSDLSDVNTSTATNRNVLVADGVDWESRALTEADISDLGSYLPLSGGTLSGNIAFSGAQTVDGRDVSADGSKLDGIESSADVTDAANVASAGAVMADGTGNDITGDLVFTEKADHSSTPGAGKGYLWVKSDTPSSLIYTDDAGTDYDLTAAGGGGDLWSDAVDSDIVPTGADGTYDLGTTTDRFAQTYTDTIWITDGDITASVADGASAVAFDFNNTTTLSTAGANLARFSNNGTAVFDFSYQGGIDHVNSGATTAAHSQSLNLNWSASGAQTSSGQYSCVMGLGNTASGLYALAVGRDNTASYEGAVCFGRSNSALWNFAFSQGFGNSNTGNRAAVFGYTNTVDGPAAGENSLTMGHSAQTIHTGAFVIGGGGPSVGSAQAETIPLYKATTDATQTTLLADGADNLVIPADTTWAFSALVVGRSDETDGNDSAAYRLEGLLTRDESNNTALVGSVTKTVIAESAGATAWDATAEADDTNEALAIKVTGEAGTNIRWVAKVDIAQVTYA